MIKLEEEILLEANTVCCMLGDTNNNFAKILESGNKYKNLYGLTPIYLFDEETNQLVLEFQELDKKNIN